MYVTHVWYRYVEDTFVVIQTEYIDKFTNHIKNIDNIKFTSEGEDISQLPFLDTLAHRRTGRCGVLAIATWAAWFRATQGRLLTKKKEERKREKREKRRKKERKKERRKKKKKKREEKKGKKT